MSQYDIIWLGIGGTSTSTVLTPTAATAGADLTVRGAVTYSATISGLTIAQDWTKLYLTLKPTEEIADTAATVQLVVSNPSAGTDGLLYLNGAAPVSPLTAASGSLTVNQSGGAVTVLLSAAATAQLARSSALGYDVKILSGTDTVSLATEGKAEVSLTETKSIT